MVPRLPDDAACKKQTEINLKIKYLDNLFKIVAGNRQSNCQLLDMKFPTIFCSERQRRMCTPPHQKCILCPPICCKRNSREVTEDHGSWQRAFFTEITELHGNSWMRQRVQENIWRLFLCVLCFFRDNASSRPPPPKRLWSDFQLFSWRINGTNLHFAIRRKTIYGTSTSTSIYPDQKQKPIFFKKKRICIILLCLCMQIKKKSHLLLCLFNRS